MLRLCSCALFLLSAQAAVIGIDFGARFLKVGIIQPGKGIELVLNEATKRKSSTAAGFNNQQERIYGDDSFNLLGKSPGKQFVMQKLLLGKNVSASEVLSFSERGYPYKFVEDPDTAAAVLQYDENTNFRSEELVAFVLSYAKSIAEAHAEAPVRDAVIVVPPFFKATERTAMINAATIANLNVLALMHENTAFAFKYGFDKEAEFTSEPTNVVFYDMGASSLKASIASFTTTVGKKNKTTGSMTVKAVTWDDTLGGRDFDHVVLNMLCDAFVEKYPKVGDPRSNLRAMGKLRKESERAKDVLSANVQFQVGIEALFEDRDLKLVMKRAEFEERAAPLFARLLPPLELLLEKANLTKADISRVEVVGGATRIPKVKEVAADFFGLKLSASLNGDEAAAMGATLYAAKLSTSFRLRDFGIVDSFPHAISVKLGSDAEPVAAEADEEAGEEQKTKPGKDKLLFKAGTKFPHKKLITMSRTEDLMITISFGEPQSEAKEPITSFNVSGVEAALKRLSTPLRSPIGKPKVSVTFALSASGLIEVSKAEVALEMLETYDDYEVVPLNETELAELKANETAAADAEPEPEPAADEAANASANASANGTNGTNSTKVRTKTVKVQKQRKRMHYSTLKVQEVPLTSVLPLNSTHIDQAIAANRVQLEAEQLRKLNAEAKNMLESFIIDTRDKLSSDEAMEAVSTEEEREQLRAEFEKMEDWLYEEGMEAEAKVYGKKKKELEKLAAPVFLRAAEREARPKTVAQALDAINWTRNILETWATDRPEVTEAERAQVSGMCDNFTAWLDGVEEKQAALEPHETPAFLSSEVTTKLEPIEKEVRRLIKKPKPKPPKKEKAPKNATNGTANASSANTTESAAGENSTADGGGADEELPAHDEL